MAERELRKVLDGVGDPTHERMFRMCLTMCFQRALTDEERTGLGDACQIEPEHLAGGSLEVLFHNGPPEPQSAKPCENVGRNDLRRPMLYGDRWWPRIWVPVDCGECEPCEARIEAEK